MPSHNYSNHRTDERKSTLFQAKFLINDEANNCAILDISPGGAKLKTGVIVAAKTDIVVDLDKIGTFTATTAWCSNGAVGVRFTGNPELIANAVMALAMFGTG